MRLIDKIKKGIKNLPEEELQFANMYLNTRDFDSLKDLVDSSIIKIKKNLSKDTPKEEYLSINMIELNQLQCDIIDYLDQLNIPTSIGDDDIYDDEDPFIEDDEDNAYYPSVED